MMLQRGPMRTVAMSCIRSAKVQERCILCTKVAQQRAFSVATREAQLNSMMYNSTNLFPVCPRPNLTFVGECKLGDSCKGVHLGTFSPMEASVEIKRLQSLYSFDQSLKGLTTMQQSAKIQQRCFNKVEPHRPYKYRPYSQRDVIKAILQVPRRQWRKLPYATLVTALEACRDAQHSYLPNALVEHEILQRFKDDEQVKLLELALAAAINTGNEVHIESILQVGIEHQVFDRSKLLSYKLHTYVYAKRLLEARQILRENVDVVVEDYEALLRAYCLTDDMNSALQLFQDMRSLNVASDVSKAILIDGYSRSFELTKAHALHDELERPEWPVTELDNTQADAYSAGYVAGTNSLIRGYIKLGDVSTAEALYFMLLSEQIERATREDIIALYAARGDRKSAERYRDGKETCHEQYKLASYTKPEEPASVNLFFNLPGYMQRVHHARFKAEQTLHAEHGE